MKVTDVKSLKEEFLEGVYSIPDGEKINECIQCGTCSASCPTSSAMDYSPREIIAALRAGMLDRVLNSNTVWLCTSCYSCYVRCPAGIPFTDVMYELKRLGTKYGLIPPDETLPALSKAFVSSVAKYGRNFETGMMRDYVMSTNPMGGLGMLPLGIKMWRAGRLKLSPDRIEGVEDLRKMVEVLERKREEQ